MLSFDLQKKIFLINKEEIQFDGRDLEILKSLSWWQSIPFSTTVLTNGAVKSVEYLHRYQLVDDSDNQLIDFYNKSVLGIGCYEGFQLYFAEACGAREVIGIADDFNLYPGINDSREFALNKLQSNVRFVNCSIYDLNVKDFGLFDIVLVYDVFQHLKHPTLAFEKICSMFNEKLIITGKIAVVDESFPYAFFPNVFEKKDSPRFCFMPNLCCIRSMLATHKCHIYHVDYHELDYVSAFAERVDFDDLNPPPPLKLLNGDQGIEDQTIVVVVSCGKYRQAWDPFFALFKKYWPDCPYRVVLLTDVGTYEGIETIVVGKDLGWQGNLKEFLSALTHKRVILFQEDFFLTSPVDTLSVSKLNRHTHDFGIGCIRLIPAPSPSGQWPFCQELGTLGYLDDFRFSCQLSIWDRETLLSLLKEDESFWLLEFVGSRRASFSQKPFLSINRSCYPPPIDYFITGIVNGKWHPDAIKLLEKEGIQVAELLEQVADVPQR